MARRLGKIQHKLRRQGQDHHPIVQSRRRIVEYHRVACHGSVVVHAERQEVPGLGTTRARTTPFRCELPVRQCQCQCQCQLSIDRHLRSAIFDYLVLNFGPLGRRKVSSQARRRLRSSRRRLETCRQVLQVPWVLEWHLMLTDRSKSSNQLGSHGVAGMRPTFHKFADLRCSRSTYGQLLQLSVGK